MAADRLLGDMEKAGEKYASPANREKVFRVKLETLKEIYEDYTARRKILGSDCYVLFAKKDLADEETVSVTFADGAAEGSIVVPFDKNGSKPAVTVLYRGRSLTEGKDYTVSYKNNRKAGASATVTVKGKGSFTGIRKLTFTVGG